MRIPTGDAFLDVFYTVMESTKVAAADEPAGLYEQIIDEKHAETIFDTETTYPLHLIGPDMLRAFVLATAATNLHVGIMMGLEMARRDGWTG